MPSLISTACVMEGGGKGRGGSVLSLVLAER